MVRSPVNVEERKNLGIKAGDTVRVTQKIQEKGKTRLQAFEGLVLAKKHGAEAGATFTVRKVASGVGVEKVFPLYSPMIDKIEIVRRATVRRAKLYYIREKVAKEIRRAMRGAAAIGISTESDIARKDRVAKEEADEIEARAKAEADAAAAAEAAVAPEPEMPPEVTAPDTPSDPEESKPDEKA